jgi:glutamine amidotransferase
MQRLVLIDYGSGNLRSAAKALERAAQESGVATEVLVTADAEDVRRADRVVLPGVGAFADCKAGLSALPGMIDALEERVIRGGVPFLGICVGMQLMARLGREYGVHEGLGWIDGEVVPLDPGDGSWDPALKIPHMGWNLLVLPGEPHPLLAKLGPAPHVYFVHSYHFQAAKREEVLAQFDYGGLRTAVVGRDNLAGCQFHPEKSQAVGLTLLSNFLRWSP